MDKPPITLKLDYGYPTSPVLPGAIGEKPEDAQYPCFHYEGLADLDLPVTGTMTVRYRVKSETSEVDRDGKHHYRCDIEISSIEKIKGDSEFTPPAKSGSEAADALDALMEAHEDDNEGDKD
jgi:hypothetical protein